MLKRRLSTALLCGLCLLLLPTDTDATRRDRRKKPKAKKEITVVHTRFAIAPKLTIGLATGEAADVLGGSKNTSILGGGMTFEYSVSPRSRLGLNTDLLYGLSLQYKYDNKTGVVRAVNYSGSFVSLLTPLRQKSLFGRVEYGFCRVTAINPADYEPQTTTFFRIGLGGIHYSRPSTSSRLELYYRYVFTEDEELVSGSHTDILGFDVTSIGLELTMCLGF
ncbi:MAG: hypothetical protein ABII79_14410 [bacterium]